MTGRDRGFALGVLALSALVVPALLAARPFDESRASFGLVAGWVGALAIILPSYVWLSRVLARSQPHAFVRGFMASITARMFAAVALMVGFMLLVKDAPTASFLGSFMLGYLLLTGLELWVVLRGARQEVSA